MQAQLIPALAVIHNFICTHDPSDLPEPEDDGQGTNGDDNAHDDDNNVPEGRGAGVACREKIALDMWAEYQNSNHHHM